jgi:hypothetical protein
MVKEKKLEVVDPEPIKGQEPEADEESSKEEITKYLREHETDLQGKKTEEVVAQTRRSIIIHNQDGPGGNHAVFVAVNGVGYNIPREIEVSVPVAVIHALENATETRYFREMDDGKEFGPILSRQVRRFPFYLV